MVDVNNVIESSSLNFIANYQLDLIKININIFVGHDLHDYDINLILSCW